MVKQHQTLDQLKREVFAALAMLLTISIGTAIVMVLL
jgi:hypothetical protein